MGYRTGDLGLGGVLRSRGEQQLLMLSTRQRSILDAVVVYLSTAVFPLKSDALVCQLHCLQVSGGVQVYNAEIYFRKMLPHTNLKVTAFLIED